MHAPTSDDRIRELKTKVRQLNDENRRLRSLLLLATNTNVVSSDTKSISPPVSPSSSYDLEGESVKNEIKLTKHMIERYSRQLVLSDQEFGGVQSQRKLLQAKVLVVGAGGIGSTVLQYLGSSGVGQLAIVDFDVVEMSNLHRQIIHSMKTVGLNKAESAKQRVLDLNPTIHCVAIPQAVTVDNVMELVESYDCIVDASDNPATRYLLNDACCFTKTPLVSGSAVGTEGQCTVYHHTDGPCYRCMFPKPAIQNTCRTCSDAGVLGPVPGLIGILQAMEVLKILTGKGDTLCDRLVMYDAMSTNFYTIKKPPKQASCDACGTHPQIRSIQNTHDTLSQTRGPKLIEKTPPNTDFDVSCIEYHEIVNSCQPHVLLDVRPTAQFEMCALPQAVNIPLDHLCDNLDRLRALLKENKEDDSPNMIVYCICRRGNASIDAVQILHKQGFCSVKNIREGLVAWHRDVDRNFPSY